MTEITIQAPKNNKKKLFSLLFHQLQNHTPLSLFRSYPKFRDNFEICKTRNIKTLNRDETARNVNAVEWVYENKIFSQN